MAEDFLDYCIRIFRPLFPARAWIVGRISKGDHIIQIDWRLESDPDVPNRRSRKIEITIREEAVDGYLNKTKAEQALAETNLKNWISERYMDFDPEHDAKSCRAVQTDRWLIPSDVLG